MEKIVTVVNKQTAKELSTKNQILAIGAFVFGLICIGLYFLFSILDKNFGSILYIIMLGIGGMLVGISILFEAAIIKRINLYKNNNYESTYEFLDHYIVLEAFRNGEKFQEAKIKYEEIFGYWELTNYVLIKLNNGNALPIKKVSGLTDFLDSKGVIRRKK